MRSTPSASAVFMRFTLALAAPLWAACSQASVTDEAVGQVGPNAYMTPANQRLTPSGLQVELPEMRPQALALSPDGTRLVTAGKTHDSVVVSPATGEVLQRVALPSDKNTAGPTTASSPRFLSPDKDGQLSFTGLIFSPDGTRIYLSNVNGSIKVFSVDAQQGVAALFSIPLPHADAPRRAEEIPAGLAISPDGSRLFVCANLSNRLLELNAIDGRVLRAFDVGVAPFDVVLSGNQAFVSNWGGRRPDANSITGPAGRGTIVRVDGVRHIASEGSVTIVDLVGAAPAREIITGLHASAMALSPTGAWLAVANSGSDTVSVIDTKSAAIVETICVRQSPADLFGAQPTALAFDSSGKRLFVCNGSQNAVAVIDFDPGESKPKGLISVGWFPGAVVVAPTVPPTLCVANIKGIGSTKKLKEGEKAEFRSRQYFGTLSLVPLPTEESLPAMTRAALDNMRYGLLREAMLPARLDQPARAVPERAGEPSHFKHVVYIIKENRTYDQVFGDLREGNGDASLCVFGEEITPNLHKIAREFVLLDNTYCSGILSADGHQWADTGLATEYVERSFAGFPRSYPDGMELDGADALAYSSAGFIWDHALARGKSLRVFGEFAITRKRWAEATRKDKITARACYDDFVKKAGAVIIESEPTIESLRPYLSSTAPGWDMEIPDVVRASAFMNELKAWEAAGGMPNLIIISLPNDHTSGTSAGLPTPAAAVADNDLAFGQIVEAISASAFWKDTCIFAIEDDPQNGWDHISGYRTTAFVVSPYTKRGAVVSTQYNHTSILRTIELMLGIPPMNQFDATATPMRECFTEQANLTPYRSVENRVPLDELNPDPKAIADDLLRANAIASSQLPLERIDQCPEDELNRIIWHAMKGSMAAYPEWAVSLVDDDDDDDANGDQPTSTSK